MKFFLTCLLSGFLAISGHSQQITAYKTFGGMRFEMDTLYLSHRQVSELLSINPEAAKEFKQARRANAASGLLGFAGALLVAIPVFSVITGGEPEWGPAIGGAALIIASIPLSIIYHRKSMHAIDTYNASAPGKARLYISGSAIGIKF